jgi:hypothetical protein
MLMFSDGEHIQPFIPGITISSTFKSCCQRTGTTARITLGADVKVQERNMIEHYDGPARTLSYRNGGSL